MRVLVLGGTLQARHVCAALAPDHSVTLALKGLTARPVIPAGVTHRQGGFGGVSGLATALSDFDLLIDATHPFAAGMSRNAWRAGQLAAVPLLAVQRPPWRHRPGDRWMRLPTLARAAHRLRHARPRRIMLALGGQGAEMFRGLPQHEFSARVLASSKTDLATLYGRRWRGLRLDRFDSSPSLDQEMRTLAQMDLMILRNAGGPLDAKLTAARRLKLPVWIVDRPAMPPVPIYGSVAALMDAVARL